MKAKVVLPDEASTLHLYGRGVPLGHPRRPDRWRPQLSSRSRSRRERSSSRTPHARGRVQPRPRGPIGVRTADDVIDEVPAGLADSRARPARCGMSATPARVSRSSAGRPRELLRRDRADPRSTARWTQRYNAPPMLRPRHPQRLVHELQARRRHPLTPPRLGQIEVAHHRRELGATPCHCPSRVRCTPSAAPPPQSAPRREGVVARRAVDDEGRRGDRRAAARRIHPDARVIHKGVRERFIAGHHGASASPRASPRARQWTD